MRLLTLAALLLTACGAAPGKACIGDSSCSGDLVCSSSGAEAFCTPLCEPGQHASCEAAMGPGSGCYKYVGPDSAGYGCSKR